ncbi:hypothetical protein [Janthinobacterium sp. 17J80-10]|uniref:hypothetical protein n=1 Tax=Janthinobacterium sp. 17J80-10 TaxID=2497863 RepID=UPI0010058A2C|nr:hypothetical protein [Janthinobacterium sp. 17J80-10]QAU34134.1 hypothetical protein EKL02_08005 [Janthinobacterium sp. 17J80-10]
MPLIVKEEKIMIEEASKKGRFASRAGVIAAITAGVVACAGCCAPLIAPLVAWLGISALGAAATGWYLGIAGLFALGVSAILWLRHRRKSLSIMSDDACCNRPSCKI